jgi:hypothetical protein
MSDPLEVEVVSIDGAPPPQQQETTRQSREDWFRFDRRFSRPAAAPRSSADCSAPSWPSSCWFSD